MNIQMIMERFEAPVLAIEPEYDEIEMVYCPICHGEQPQASAMGGLGNRLHYRCRFCGVGFSKEV